MAHCRPPSLLKTAERIPSRAWTCWASYKLVKKQHTGLEPAKAHLSHSWKMLSEILARLLTSFKTQQDYSADTKLPLLPHFKWWKLAWYSGNREREEDIKFKASLGNKARSSKESEEVSYIKLSNSISVRKLLIRESSLRTFPNWNLRKAISVKQECLWRLLWEAGALLVFKRSSWAVHLSSHTAQPQSSWQKDWCQPKSEKAISVAFRY